jgi:hypothetical protein
VIGNGNREECRGNEEESDKRQLGSRFEVVETLIAGLCPGQDAWRCRSSVKVTHKTSEEDKNSGVEWGHSSDCESSIPTLAVPLPYPHSTPTLPDPARGEYSHCHVPEITYCTCTPLIRYCTCTPGFTILFRLCLSLFTYHLSVVDLYIVWDVGFNYYTQAATEPYKLQAAAES